MDRGGATEDPGFWSEQSPEVAPPVHIQTSPWRPLGWMLTSFLGIPLALCVVVAASHSGGIGPFVFLKFLVDLFLMPFLAYSAISSAASMKLSALAPPIRTFASIALVVSATVTGLVVAILGINLFILFTQVFGIMDYQLG